MDQKDLRNSQPTGKIEEDQVHSLKWRAGLQWALAAEVHIDLTRTRGERCVRRWVGRRWYSW